MTSVSPGQLSANQDSSISLPASLFKRVNDQESVGIFFALYEMATLFPVGGGRMDLNAPVQTQVGSQVVAATVESSTELVDLEEPVTLAFRRQLIGENMVCCTDV